MTAYCFSWVNEILNQIKGANDDNSVVETSIILQKQPLLLNLRPPKPQRRRLLILRYFCPKHLKLYIIDGGREKECTLRGLHSLRAAVLVTTCNELILLSCTTTRSQFGVFNPKSNQSNISTIDPPLNLPTAQPCAFFFHPIANEHRILAVGDKLNKRPGGGGGYEYQIYSFQSKTWRQTATPYFRFRPISYWKSADLVNGEAAIVNNALHWWVTVGQIMVFDTVREEFEVKDVPFMDHLQQMLCFQGYLLRKGEEELCFCAVGRREAAMEVWICEDYERWRWCRKFKIDLSWGLEFDVIEASVTDSYHVVKVVGFGRDGEEVMMFWRHRGLFVYNLESKSVERIWVKKLKLHKDNNPINYDLYCGFQPYLASMDDDH